ncbi:hypothetical protein HYPSUDRAFT_189656 [Hypholoma sublateritium FD-334 SS-4]|uniref:Macrofage activating glycoprotein n=1 Tax=Hypholoma sublateritium (strain FD-334 SS-4) TaxID=945553 RepID=A0A0D2M8T7_HYPSF|nr:hypothetical protein HYPSUDRAFT_189656 [Hypholoma sublateritium FD-334 SS-4]
MSTYPATPLASKTFTYPSGIPYQVDTDTNLIRGVQKGYNLCNSTTETQESLCQTSFFTSLDDFCLWAPPDANSTVADTEGEMVAWCSKPGYGTRLIPAGTLTGLQFLKTPDYIQIVGFMDQTQINMASGDYGGEMDPHGADLRGNPMGGIMFSQAWNSSWEQVIEWTNFMGSNSFCLKACDPAGANAASYCQHIYDRIGCAYNAPNAAQDLVFEACDADNADFPGVYTDTAGAVVTYTQPAESLGAITTMPYTATVPASSNCVTYTSSVLFSALASVTASASGSAAASTGTAKASSSTAKASTTGTSASASSTASSGADALVVSGAASLMGVVFAGLFLA